MISYSLPNRHDLNTLRLRAIDIIMNLEDEKVLDMVEMIEKSLQPVHSPDSEGWQEYIKRWIEDSNK